MPYIGNIPADRSTGARVRDEYVADGTQICFPLSQEVPGSFESNVLVIIENVLQEPLTAYTIINTFSLSLSGISGTFTKNETVTGGTSGATGVIIKVNLSSVEVRVTSGTFQVGETITGGSSSASATTTVVFEQVGKGLLISETPAAASVIYVLHQAQATYNLKPAAGSVTPESLSENLRTFTVDKFTATSSQTTFTLSTTPASVNSILVFVDGVLQTATTNYTLSGVTVTMGAALTAGQQVTIVHLGFSTVSRTAFADQSVTTNMIADNAITSDKIAPGTVVASDVADGGITTAKLANDAVTQDKIADDAVGLDQLSATGTPDSSKFLRGDNSWQVVAVTPTAVSDQSNSSTGAFALPAGTTAQRPATAYTGYQRYNTDLEVMEYYDGTNWFKISAATPILSSVSGSIIVGFETTLTLTGSGFLSANLIVNFFQLSDGINENVTVTPTTDAEATVTVPAAVYNNVTSGNVVAIKVTNSDGIVSASLNKTSITLPSGGSTVISGNYRYHVFTSTSNLVVPSGLTTTMQYLIIAGGGGGGGYGGGGGAGGQLYATATVSPGTYTATIGPGGTGASTNGATDNTNGTNSSFNGSTAIGGGRGGSAQTLVGQPGGSGGGTGYGTGDGGSSTLGQGNNGGGGSPDSDPYPCAGGGGAGAVGGTYGPIYQAGAGGSGSNTYATWLSAISSLMTGVSGWTTATASGFIAGGGGGGIARGNGYTNYPNFGGAGGVGGGGEGGWYNGVTRNGGSGKANTGGGGGGGGYDGTAGVGGTGGTGGSGLVIVRYDLSAL